MRKYILIVLAALCCLSCTNSSISENGQECVSDSIIVFGTTVNGTPWQFAQSMYEASLDSSNIFSFFPEEVKVEYASFTIMGHVNCAENIYTPLTIHGECISGFDTESKSFYADLHQILRLEIQISDTAKALSELTTQYGNPAENGSGSYDWTINHIQSISLYPHDSLPLLILRILAP